MNTHTTFNNQGIIRDINRTKVNNSSTYGEYSKKSTTAYSERTVFVGSTPKFGPFTISVQNCDGIDVIRVNGLELYKFAHGAAVDLIVRLLTPRIKEQTVVLMSAESTREITSAVADMLALHYKQTERQEESTNNGGRSECFYGLTDKREPFHIGTRNTAVGDVVTLNGIDLSVFSDKAAIDVVTRYVQTMMSTEGFGTAEQAAEARAELVKAVGKLLSVPTDVDMQKTSLNDEEGQTDDGFVFIGMGTVELDVGDGFIFEYTERVGKKPLVLLNQKKLKSHTVDIKPVRDVAAFLLNQFGAHGESIDAFIIGTLNGIAKIHQSEKAQRKAEKKERKTDGPAGL